MKNKLYKFTLIYIIIFYVLATIGFVLIKNYYKNNYSQEKLDILLNSKSIWDNLSDNPCNAQIFSNPVSNKEGSIQINLYCSSGQKSLNTLSLIALKDNKTLKNAIQEIGKINAFNPKQIFELNNKWNCLLNKNKISDFNISISNGNIINCYQNK
ncbi:MAG TPA: hypothetical protein PK257_00995 [Candidatus Woesebacteria bacterium]|nr:hypothetical protein [Candidatus Woesebacteria bacterium]